MLENKTSNVDEKLSKETFIGNQTCYFFCLKHNISFFKVNVSRVSISKHLMQHTRRVNKWQSISERKLKVMLHEVEQEAEKLRFARRAWSPEAMLISDPNEP